MFHRLTVLVLATAFVAAAASPFAQANVAGDWTLTINGPQGIIDSDASLKQDGGKVTGTMSSPMGETAIAGTLAGSTLSLAFSVQSDQGPIDVTMTADVTGAEMKGTLDYGMGTADFTGKKK
ncbi:MAG TPA: hypothetical protein PLH72_12825 [Vicinamibacterales bacterium]|nr:hypothetical protein [Vicinamibacterales bacterium]